MSSRILSPNLYIIAGPNGVGKTTFAQEFLPKFAHCPQFVNADLIARGLSPFLPEDAAFKAGRLLLERIRNLAASRCDFGFETTLSGKGYLALLKKLKQEGYSIHLFFFWVDDVGTAIARIRGRVRIGGHHVPDDVVRRRFGRGLLNFLGPYKALLDSWILLENSNLPPIPIARAMGGKVIIEEKRLYEAVLRSRL